MRILNYGSLNIDLVYSVSHFVRAGETIASTGFSRFAGGKGLNQSIALGRAGADVAHGGKVGPDGLFLIALLREAGVDTACLSWDGSATGTALIQVDESGQNCIIIHGGANRENTEAEIDRMLEGFGAGDMLLLQNEVSLPFYAMRKAKDRGMRVAINPSPMSDDLGDIPADWVDIWLLNELEGSALTGREASDEILDAMQRRYPAAQIVLTLGAGGSACRCDGQTYRQPTLPVAVIDTTAAGDTFTGYYLAVLMRGDAIPDALRLATRAAAIAITRPGAAPSIPTMAEVCAL